jgi:hypothetical protein
MIPDTAFLRQIPTALALEVKLPLSAIAFTIDTIYLRYLNIKHWALDRLSKDMAPPTLHEQIALFVEAWSIVDYTYMARSLLKALPHKATIIDSFVDTFEVATHMRNGMDHVDKQMTNIVKKKNTIPLYGTFSFTAPNLSDTEPRVVTGGRVFAMTSGLTHPPHQFPVIHPWGMEFEYPVGLFSFWAFEMRLDISALARTLAGVVKVFDDSKPNLEKRIQEAVTKSTISEADKQKVLTDHTNGGGLIVVSRFVSA